MVTRKQSTPVPHVAWSVYANSLAASIAASKPLRHSQPGPSGLTERERDVLGEMAQGKSNQAIAETLSVSESAVEKHISAIFRTLELDASNATVNRRVAAVLTFLESYEV